MVTSNTLELANDTFFLGSGGFGSKLFIRPCFKELSEMILSGGWKNMVVTRKPVGKSVFGFHLRYVRASLPRKSCCYV